MARPLVSDVYTAARSQAGDPAGKYLTDTILQPFLQFAYSELFRAMQGTQNPRTRQETYYNLPAYTSVLDPATANILNLGEIESIEERGGITSISITSVTSGAGLLNVGTSGPHGFSSGNQIVQYGIGGFTSDADGLFTITVVSDPGSYTANGCTATGIYTSGGVASKSTEEFYEVVPHDRLTFISSSPQTTLRNYAWEGDLIYFPACSALRQLRITYSLSGDAPTVPTATVPIDDSLGFLSFRMAGLALQARGNRVMAATFNEMAVGRKWADGVIGGILEQLLSSGVRNLQRLPPCQRQPPPFRNRRTRNIW